MKKRIGSKLYDTDNGVLVVPDVTPGKHLYKQPKNRTFYFFDGVTIQPVTFDEAADIIRGAGDPDLLRFLEVKPSPRGCVSLSVVSPERFYKLERIAKARGVSIKSRVEAWIDGLPDV